MQLNFEASEDYYYAIALAVLAFLTAPAIVYVNNAIDLHHVDPVPSLAILTASALAAAAILCLLLYGLSRIGLQTIGVLLRPLFFFLLFMTIIQPLIGNEAALNIGAAHVPVWWLSMMVFLVIAMVWSLTKLSGTLLLIALAFIALNTLVHAYQLFKGGTAKDPASIVTLSKDKNLIVLSMDGVNRDTARKVLDENPELKSKLKDFVFFTNAVTSAPNTRASIIAELTGTKDLKKLYGDERTMIRTVPRKTLLHNVLAANGVTVATYGEYSHTLLQQKNAFPVGDLLTKKSFAFHIVNAVDLFHFAMPAALWPDSLAKYFQKFWLTFTRTDGSISPRLDRLNAHTGERWERALLLSGIEFDNYLARLQVSGDKPRAQFLHFVHSHWPISIDAKCAYQADDFKWYLKHQDHAAHKAVTYCSLSQFAAFLQKLKDLKVYDKATIVLKGDHGEIIPYMDRAKLESFTFHGHKHLGFSRYTPMLAIKGAGHSTGQMTLDARPVALSDLALTLCKAELGDNPACGMFKGYNLLDPGAAVSARDTYILYLPKTGTSDWKLDDHVSTRVARRANVFATLNGKISGKLLQSALPCDAPVNLAGGRIHNNGKTDGKSWVTWRDGQSWFIKTKTPDCPARQVQISFAAEQATADAGSSISASINGKTVQVKLAKSSGGQESWTLTLPPDFKPDALLEISLTSAPGQKPKVPNTLKMIAGQPIP